MQRVRVVYDAKTAAQFINPSETVFTDPLSKKFLEFKWKYPREMKVVDFENIKAEEIPSGSFILFDQTRLDWLKINVDMWLTNDYGYHKPPFYEKPLKNWNLVWENYYTKLYKVN